MYTCCSISSCPVFIYFYSSLMYYIRYLQVSGSSSRFCYTRQQRSIIENITDTKLLQKNKYVYIHSMIIISNCKMWDQFKEKVTWTHVSYIIEIIILTLSVSSFIAFQTFKYMKHFIIIFYIHILYIKTLFIHSTYKWVNKLLRAKCFPDDLCIRT